MSGQDIHILDDVIEGDNYISNIQRNLEKEEGYASDKVFSRNDNRAALSVNVSQNSKYINKNDYNKS